MCSRCHFTFCHLRSILLIVYPSMVHKINLRNYFLHKLFYTPRKDGKFVVYIDTEEIAKRYFGEDTNGRCKEWVTFDRLSCSNDELILTYWIGGKQCIGKGEFRFKWDEAAQWFSVEQVAY